MKFIINDQMVLLRAPEGPLAPYIASFSKWAIEQGYAHCSLQQRVRIAAGFSRWLAGKSRYAPCIRVEDTTEMVPRWREC